MIVIADLVVKTTKIKRVMQQSDAIIPIIAVIFIIKRFLFLKIEENWLGLLKEKYINWLDHYLMNIYFKWNKKEKQSF